MILKGYILVPDSDLDALQSELAVHSELTRQEEGCLIFEVSQDKGTKNKFNVYGELTNRDFFSAQQDRLGNQNGVPMRPLDTGFNVPVHVISNS